MSVSSEKKKEETKNYSNYTQIHIHTLKCPECGIKRIFKVQNQMQEALSRLGVNLIVQWKPDKAKPNHGEIKGNVIFLYSDNEAEAWTTFTHEVTEYKLQNVTRPYRLLVNNLIEAVEKSIYAEKEQFIDFLPKMVDVIRESQKTEQVSS